MSDAVMSVDEPQVEGDFVRGTKRKQLLHGLLPLLAAGKSYQYCAQKLGSSAATLNRIKKAYDEGGESALITNHGNAGRRPAANFDVFTDEAIAYVKRLTIRTESLPLALERLSDAGPCSAEARELIDLYREKANYPPSFYRFFRITEAEWAKAKGEKTFDGVTHTARRGMWFINENGHREDILSGDVMEADDVSTDTPFYVQLPDGSYRVGRQMLMFRDLRSKAWRGAYPVARERDSYRGEDIVRACRELVDAWGMPTRFRFERGSWESNIVMGIKLKQRRSDADRVGGIPEIIPINTVFTSRAKGGIEGGMRMFHKVMGLHGVRIGKTRGEYETPTADMLAVNQGRKDPRDCGFIAWDDLLPKLEQALSLLNGRPTYYSEFGAKFAPDDVWTQDMEGRPNGRLPACPPEQFWRFLPVKREVSAGIARAGHVKVSVPGYPLPFFFRIGGPGLVYVGDGMPAEGVERNVPFIDRKHRLLVCFDPHRAAEGAVIVNAERGPRNTEGWALGQRLFVAPLDTESPQFDLSGGARDSEDVRIRKTRDAQVKASFTSIGLYRQGARRTRQDFDGESNAGRVETGAPARSRSPVAAPVHKPRKRDAEPVHIEDFTGSVEATYPRRLTKSHDRRQASTPVVENFTAAAPADDPPEVIEEDLDLR